MHEPRRTRRSTKEVPKFHRPQRSQGKPGDGLGACRGWIVKSTWLLDTAAVFPKAPRSWFRLPSCSHPAPRDRCANPARARLWLPAPNNQRLIDPGGNQAHRISLVFANGRTLAAFEWRHHRRLPGGAGGRHRSKPGRRLRPAHRRYCGYSLQYGVHRRAIFSPPHCAWRFGARLSISHRHRRHSRIHPTQPGARTRMLRRVFRQP